MAALVPTMITAIDNLITTLEAIDATGSYYHDINKVSKVVMPPEAFTTANMPGLLILPGDVAFTSIGSGGRMTTGSDIASLPDGWLVEIIGYLNPATDTALAGTMTDEMIYLIQDVAYAIANDRTLTSTVLNTELVSATSPAEWIEQSQGLLIVIMTFSIKFDFTPSTSM